MVDILLAANASPLQTSNDGKTAFNYAMSAGRQLIALQIVEAAALHAMDSENSAELLLALKDGAYVNIRNAAGWTPLIFAASRGDVESVKAILNYGGDPNRAENDGWTPLHFAAHGGNEDIVLLLLKAGANVSWKNLDGRTPRELAAAEGFQNIVEMIPEIVSEL